jgi:hypothetical protein
MKKARWISAVASAAVLVAGFALPAGAAVTDGGGNGNAGFAAVGSGNTVSAPVSAPVDVYGIAAAVNAPVSLPVDVCGIAVALLGFADAGCQGGAATSTVITSPSGPTPCPPTPCPTPPPSCKCTPPPGGNTPPGGNGGAPGGQTGSGTTSVPGSLPITGADLLGMGIAAVGAVGIGGASPVIARRRRDSEV